MSADLILLIVSLFFWGVGEGMFLYFQPIYLEQFGASPLVIGTVFSAFGAMMMSAHIPAGYLADRIGRRPLMRLAWLVGLAAVCVMAAARSLPLFIAGMLLYGLTAFVNSPLLSYVTAARGKHSAGRTLTLVSAAFNLGAILGPLIGGWIGEQFSLSRVYMVAAVVLVFSVATMFFIRPQPRDHHDPKMPPVKLRTNHRYIVFLGVCFLAVFVMYLPQPLTPNFLQNERGLSLLMIGRLGSAASLGTVLFNLILGQLNTRLGFALGQVAVGLFAFLLWRGGNMLWYAAGYFLLGGYRTARVLSFAQVRSLIHQAQMGLAYGIVETVNSLAIILAPLFAGYLYELNPAWMYPVSLGMLVFALLATLLFMPRGIKAPVMPTPDIGLDS